MHHQKPVHTPRLRADEFRAAKIRKRGQRRMRRAADKIDRAVAQRRVSFVDRKDEFELDIETLGLEEAKLDRGFGRKIRIRDHIRHGEFHGYAPRYFFPSNSQPNFSRALRATSGLGMLVGGNLSRQWNGRQASITATECVMSPAARLHGGSTGSAGESQEPLMN